MDELVEAHADYNRGPGGKCQVHIDTYTKFQRGERLSAEEREDWNHASQMALNAAWPLTYIFGDTVGMDKFYKTADWCSTPELSLHYREMNKRGNTPLSEGTIANHGRAILNLTTWLRGEYCFDDEVCHGLDKVLTHLHPLVNNMSRAQKDRNIVAKIVSPFNVMMSKEEVYDFIQSNWVAEQRECLMSPGWNNREWSQEELYDASSYIAMLLISRTAKRQKVIANLQGQHVT